MLHREKGAHDLSRDVVERAAGLGINIDPVTLKPLGTVPPKE